MFLVFVTSGRRVCHVPFRCCFGLQLLTFVSDLISTFDFAWPSCAFKLCISISYACFVFSSSFSSVVRSAMNSFNNLKHFYDA